MQLKFAIQNIVGYEVFETQTAAQQIIGREGETATLFSRCLFNSNGLGGGFAPRHLNRWAAIAYYGRSDRVRTVCVEASIVKQHLRQLENWLMKWRNMVCILYE